MGDKRSLQTLSYCHYSQETDEATISMPTLQRRNKGSGGLGGHLKISHWSVMTPGLPDSAHDAEANAKEKTVCCLLVSSVAPSTHQCQPCRCPQTASAGPFAGLQVSRGTYGADSLAAEGLL